MTIPPINNKNQKKKKEVLKLLKNIGIDTRFISYTDEVIYINDQRFSKFSKKRQETFSKYYPEIAIISSSLFHKICVSASKVLANVLFPKCNLLILMNENPSEKNSKDKLNLNAKNFLNLNDLLYIVLEPYSRKYGINIIQSEQTDIKELFSDSKNTYLNNQDIDFLALPLTLDEEIQDILSDVFEGKGLNISEDIFDSVNRDFTDKNAKSNIKNGNNAENNIKNNNESNSEKNDKHDKVRIVYPFIYVSNNTISSFLHSFSENKDNINNFDENLFNSNVENKNNKEVANSFMNFIEDIIPQYKENIIKSAIYVKKNNENLNK